MSWPTWIAILIGFILAVILRYLMKSKPKKPPQLDPLEWWGPNNLRGMENQSIVPFQVEFSQEMIKDLKDRIKNHRPLTPPLEGVGFQYGFNSSQLPGWLHYWAEEYPFKEREQFLNQYPQYKTNIQGLNIHFIRVKPEVPAGVKVLPLLLIHGWPGSVREFYETIPFLTQHQAGLTFAFEVIVPSIPGYGFSDAAVRPGLGAPKVAVIFNNLMNRLGFSEYFVQGGDWGAAIASALATLYPEKILGHHSNMAVAQNSRSTFWTFVGAYFPSLVMEPQQAKLMYPLSKLFAFLMEEFGYFHIQATKPDTAGVGISDSPAGLLVYILEKFSTWTQVKYRDLVDGGLGSRFTKDQLIDNLMIYWSSNSITTSMRLYAESLSKSTRDLQLESFTTPVPTWALQAKHEIFYQPPKLLKTKYINLIGHTELDEGGHFLAFELPAEFANDVFKAVAAFREWNKANGRSDT